MMLNLPLDIKVLLFFSGLYSSFFYIKENSPRPHIIFILADDLGWNDVSFHGASDIPTPNIDALALSGIILNNYYAEWMCTPSRAAFLTGKYPMRLGLQHYVIVAGEATGLPLNETTLPQRLKKLGYQTHIVGKWHQGYQSKSYLPTNRGFDTFFGYLNGFLDYFDYTHSCNLSSIYPNHSVVFGVDLYEGTDLVSNFRGKYATQVFGQRAKDIIIEHDTSEPLFLYLSHLAIHNGNMNQPLQAPPQKIAQFSYLTDPNRRIHAARLSELDDTIGAVFESLQRKDMLKNSIVVFVSDNGGENNHLSKGYSSNFPLRGNKHTVWEGGLRVPGVIWSPFLKLGTPIVSKHLMHVTDWLPTLYSAAGGKISDLGEIDGINMWDTLSQNVSSPRTQILNGLDPVYGVSAFRKGDFKLVNGSTGKQDLWYGSTGSGIMKGTDSMYEWIFKNGSVVRDVLMQGGWWIAQNADEVYDAARIVCPRPSTDSSHDCVPDKGPCLFNITKDPCELKNLAKKYPDMVKSMMQAIHDFSKEQAPAQYKMSDPKANPACHGFAYVPWLDPEHVKQCELA